MLFRVTIIKTDGGKSYHFHQTRDLAERWLEKQRKYMNISTSIIEPYDNSKSEQKIEEDSKAWEAKPLINNNTPDKTGAEPPTNPTNPTSTPGGCSPCEAARRKRLGLE